MTRRRIGLLGGSFNPAHAGHLHISLEAMKRLRLQEVWWLVSPQNPLKSSKDMADATTRFRHAQALAAPHPKIRVSDYESRHALYYSVDTVAALQQKHPTTQFFWIMGADNLVQFHRWRRWRKLAARVPVIVLDRAPYSHGALRSKMAIALKSRRVSVATLAQRQPIHPPIWAYGFVRRHPQSATALRLALGKRAFFSHN